MAGGHRFRGRGPPAAGHQVGYLAQEPELDPNKTVRESVEEGVGEVLQAQAALEAVYAAYAEEGADFDALAKEQERLEAILAAGDAHTLETSWTWPPMRSACRRGMPRSPTRPVVKAPRGAVPPAAAEAGHAAAGRTDQPPRRRVGGMAGTVPGALHRHRGGRYPRRYFLDNAAEWILELDRGRGIPWKGNYTEWLVQKDERLKQEENQEKARQKAIQKELVVAPERQGRRSKGKARLARLEELQSQDYQKRNETNEIFIPPGERLGNMVMEFKNVSKKFGDRLLIDNLSMLIPPGAIVGIIGPNGAGKSTLFKMITGQEKPDSGEIVIGPTVQLSYVDQSRDKLEGNHNVFQEIAGAWTSSTSTASRSSRAYIGRFNFKGQDQQKMVGSLSGGEGRPHMAKTLLQGGVLLLDEPSNDLDIETLRALEDALLEFPGNTFVISHDRWFLDRIATHIIAFEGDSHVEFFQGNYREYEEDKKRRMGDDAAPKRLRFKALKPRQ